MIIINIVTIFCLSIMTAGLFLIVANLITKSRADRINYIRAFKKGKGVLIYIFAIPLYWVGLVYAGDGILNGFFNSVKKIIDLIVLKYDITPVQALVDANPLFAVAMYVCFILVGLNAILFAMSLAIQYMWSFFKNLFFKFTKKEKLLLFGNNENNYAIYKSDKARAKMIVDRIESKDTMLLYMRNISFVQVTSFNDYVVKRVKECVKKGRKIISVINFGNDEKNIQIARCFVTALSKLPEESRAKCFRKLKIFVFGDPRFEAIYEDVMADGWGCVAYVNKYQKIATDFIDRYPFTKFMDENHIDYENSLIKEDVEINAIMLGFGKTNQQIFLTSVANNQFITKDKNDIVLKKVKYHIFDKNPTENNKNLNHNYFRYKHEYKNFGKGDYLPLPDYPADENFHVLDVNDVTFYNEVKTIMLSKKKSLNYIVIAFGTDLENIDMAQKLTTKVKEWGIDNYSIFVKVRNSHKGQNLLEEENCYSIGNEKEVVYDIDKITRDKMLNMATLRNQVYTLEYAVTNYKDMDVSFENIEKVKEVSGYNWFAKKTQMERDSSIYCCLSLRTKLNLMGLDYCPIDANDIKGLTEEEYIKYYAKDDMPNYAFYNEKIDGKPIIKYTLNFPDSRRKNLAILEHFRWNSFMISKGIIPASISQIENETIVSGDVEKHTYGKNYVLRRHGNLTNFEGLVEFRKLISKLNKMDGETFEEAEERNDVIKYDYQILDDAYWILTNSGQKIIKK